MPRVHLIHLSSHVLNSLICVLKRVLNHNTIQIFLISYNMTIKLDSTGLIENVISSENSFHDNKTASFYLYIFSLTGLKMFLSSTTGCVSNVLVSHCLTFAENIWNWQFQNSNSPSFRTLVIVQHDWGNKDKQMPSQQFYLFKWLTANCMAFWFIWCVSSIFWPNHMKRFWFNRFGKHLYLLFNVRCYCSLQTLWIYIK